MSYNLILILPDDKELILGDPSKSFGDALCKGVGALGLLLLRLLDGLLDKMLELFADNEPFLSA